ncbi:MAG: replication factor C large subunit [Promethearchaeota archaeon]
MEQIVKTSMPWVEKYRPKSLSEMALPTAKLKGHKIDLAQTLRDFVIEFFKEREKINVQNKEIRIHNKNSTKSKQKNEIKMPPEKAAILLEGPPGVGKTSIVYALANDLKMDVIETNASDIRTKQALEDKLNETIKSRGIMDFILNTRKKIILIDEIDGIYGVSDKGAVPTIVRLIETTQFPIIMCANEYKQSLQPIYNLINKIEVNPLSHEEIIKIIKRILKKENITNLNEKIIELIIQKNHGDLRSIINDIQGICQGLDNNFDVDLIEQLHRDSTEDIFSLIRDLFQKVTSLREARELTNKSDVDYNFLYKWVNENLPSFYKSNEELAKAYEYLSIADEIYGRIRKTQFWSLLSYFYDLFAGGVSLVKKYKKPRGGFYPIKFPRFTATTILRLSSNEASLVNKIKEKYELSEVEIVQEFIPFLRILYRSSRKMAKEIIDFFELEANEKNLLK